MKRFGRILCLLTIAMFCLGGCGNKQDKEKAQAMQSWEDFKLKEIETIEAAYAEEDLKPYAFDSRILEVKGASYRFKGFINFKRGNVFQEQSFTFTDGNWVPVNYSDVKAEKEMKEFHEKIERLGENIEDLEEEIKEDEESLDEYKKRFESLEARKEKLEALKKELDELKGQL